MSRRTHTRPEVRITAGGVTYPLSSIVPKDRGWGELEHSTRLNGGWEVSWSIPIVRNWRHPALVRGARVDLMLGPLGIVPATLDEPDWDAGQFVAIGACREAETAMALDGSGNSSTAPNTVIDAAITRGVLSWTRVGDFGTTAVGDTNGGIVTVKSVLDTWAQKNNSRWFVNAQRQLVILPVDETTAKWLIVPGSGVLGSAAEERVDRVFARYIDSTTGQRSTATYPASTPTGGIEKGLDITDRGAMSSATAQGIAQAKWTELQGRSGWTNGLTVTAGQVTTVGGGTADLALMQAGETTALLGVPDARGVAMNTNIVLGETAYKWEDDQIQLNPVGLAARDVEGALEQIGNLAVDAINAASAPRSGDTGWTSPTLGGGWSNYGGSSQGARFRRVDGIVHIEGFILSGALNSAAFTLPTGCRPSGGTLVFAAPTNTGAGHFDIDAAGAVTPRSGGTGFFSISCSFEVG